MFRIFILLILFPMLTSAQEHDFPLQEGTIIRLASPERGRALLGEVDEFVKHLSPFDLQAKLDRTDEVSAEDYSAFAAEQVLEWSEEETGKMAEIVRQSQEAIAAKGLQLRLPEVIEVVKSTILEEGSAAGYTRGQYIVLAEKGISLGTFIHELFHVYSRNNPEKEAELYEIIGFHRCNEVPYPAAIEARRLTNPDAPFNHDFIRIEHEGKEKEAMMVLFGNKDFEGGSFFQYLSIRLMLIEGEEDHKKALLQDGEPVLLSFNDVDKLFEQIGRNTNYNIHPEEISAEHFRLLLTAEEEGPDQILIEKMQAALSKM